MITEDDDALAHELYLWNIERDIETVPISRRWALTKIMSPGLSFRIRRRYEGRLKFLSLAFVGEDCTVSQAEIS